MTTRKELFEKLAAEEKKFFNTEFLSPVLRGRPIRVRIAGINLSLKVSPADFQGWGIFQCPDQSTAQYVSEPSRLQRQKYLELYPRFCLVVGSHGDRTFGVSANESDSRVRITGRVPILLPDEIRLFDSVDVRWDGENFWFDRISSGRSRKFASDLRDAIAHEVEPDQLQIPGMISAERQAYQLAFNDVIEARRDRKEERIKTALQRGGAEFISYVERGNTYTVEYTVDGQHYNSVVDSDTLRVTSAGICLSGRDRDFDLQSLVGVLREGDDRGLIYRYH